MPHYITQTGLAFINELAIRRVGRVAQDPRKTSTPPTRAGGISQPPRGRPGSFRPTGAGAPPTSEFDYTASRMWGPTKGREDMLQALGGALKSPKVTPTSPGARGGTSGPQLPTTGPPIAPDRFTRSPSVAARLKAWDDAHPAKPVMPDARAPGPGSAGPPSPVVPKRPEMYPGAHSTADLGPPRHFDLKGNVVPYGTHDPHQSYTDVKFKYARNKYKDEREAKEAQAAKEAEELSASRMGRLSLRVGRGTPAMSKVDRKLGAKGRMNLRLKAQGRPTID